jgi:hypothetical protein
MRDFPKFLFILLTILSVLVPTSIDAQAQQKEPPSYYYMGIFDDYIPVKSIDQLFGIMAETRASISSVYPRIEVEIQKGSQSDLWRQLGLFVYKKAVEVSNMPYPHMYGVFTWDFGYQLKVIEVVIVALSADPKDQHVFLIHYTPTPNNHPYIVFNALESGGYPVIMNNGTIRAHLPYASN